MIAQTDQLPTPGELTQAQGKRAAYGIYPESLGFSATPAPTIKFYRQMRKSPTIAVARAAAFIPIKASPWSYEAKDESVPDQHVAEIERQVAPLRVQFLHDIAYAMDYGYQAWEKVWSIGRSESGQVMQLDKLKPLLADKTKPRVSVATGAFRGVEQGDIKLGPEKSLWYAFNAEAGDWFGEPRNENVRAEYWIWRQIVERIGRLVVKVTGTIPIIRYPEGKSKDASHAMVDNFDLGVTVMRDIASGKGVLMPDHLAKWAEEYIEKGGDPTKVKSWNVDVLETTAGHVGELMELAKHFETLQVRGWLVPERGILEATQAGSRADSGTAANLSLTIAEDLADNICDFVTHYVVNPILLYNFGEQAVDTVRVIHEPLSDAEKAFFRDIIKGLIDKPSDSELVQRVLDVDAMLEQAALPTRESASDVFDEQDDKGDDPLLEQLRNMPPVMPQSKPQPPQ